MSAEELSGIKEVLRPYLEKVATQQRLDMVFFMLTNIIEESSEILSYGKGAREQMMDAFGVQTDQEELLLKGVISRKKQLIPKFIVSFQR